MATALERRQQFGKAEEYRLRAIDQFKTAGHRTHFATEQCRLGWLRLNLEDAEGASECFEDAAEAQEETGDLQGLAQTCKKLGDIYLKPSVVDLSRAQEMYNRALAAFRATGEEAGEGNAYAGLGNLAARKGEVPEAIAMWTAASERFKKLGVLEKVEEIDQALKKVWRGTGSVA